MDDAAAETLVTNLWAVFPPLFKLIRRRWQRGSKEGFSIYHYGTLGVLLDRGEMSMSEIGRFLGVSRPNLTPIIDTLVHEDLVRRYTDEKDRRVTRIALTPAGEKLMCDGKKRASEDAKGLFTAFTDGDIAALITSFEKIKDLLSRLETGEE